MSSKEEFLKALMEESEILKEVRSLIKKKIENSKEEPEEDEPSDEVSPDTVSYMTPEAPEPVEVKIPGITVPSIVGGLTAAAAGAISLIKKKDRVVDYSLKGLDFILQAPAHITSDYGQKRGEIKHSGVDIRARKPTPVLAPFTGVVDYINTDKDSIGGLQLVLRRGDGFYKVGFAHLSKLNFSKGEIVYSGDVIGMTGSTGVSKSGDEYAPHLHVTLYKKDLKGDFVRIDPKLMEEAINSVPVDIESIHPAEDDIYIRSHSASTKTHNYGNIRPSDSTWVGQVGIRQSRSGKFVSFRDPYSGIRAAMINLIGYGSKRHSGDTGRCLYTVDEIINTYAPPHENSTLNYIDYVYKQTGIPRGKKFDVSEEPEYLLAILRAILIMESGTEVSIDYLRKVWDTLHDESLQSGLRAYYSEFNEVGTYLTTVTEPRTGFNSRL